MAFIIVRLIFSAVLLGISSIPVLGVLWVKRVLPRRYAIFANIALYPAFIALLGSGVLLGAWAFDLLPVGECLERHYHEDRVVNSPGGKHQAIISSGICVTGFLAVNSHDSTIVEVANPGTDKREVAFEGLVRSGEAIFLAWGNDSLLKIRLDKLIPVATSRTKIDDLTIAYSVAPDALKPIDRTEVKAHRQAELEKACSSNRDSRRCEEMSAFFQKTEKSEDAEEARFHKWAQENAIVD